MSTAPDAAKTGKLGNVGTNFWLGLLVLSMIVFGANTGVATWQGSRLAGAGTGAADLAGYFVSQFIGQKAAEKAAKILVLDRIRNIRDVQPVGDLFPEATSRAVKRALLLMESSLQDKVSVNEIANRLNCSRRQLERLFATELGISPMAAYLALRVHYAKSLLEGSDLRIGEIAYRCGFGNAGHFSRVFRQQTGITPTHLRHPSRSAGIPAKR